MGRMLDVTRHQHDFAPGRLDQALGHLGVLVLVEIGDQQIRAFAGIGDGDRSPDAAVTARDDCLLALEPLGALVGLFAVVGHGLHLGRKARHRLLLFGKGRLGTLRGHGLLRDAQVQPGGRNVGSSGHTWLGPSL
jgi:hypothetical protein